MPFGPTNIQPPAKLNFRATVGEVDNAALDIRSAEIQLINREDRIARQERGADQRDEIQYICECDGKKQAPQSMGTKNE